MSTPQSDGWLQCLWMRHGETDWNRQGRIQGHLDVPLNEQGRKQARQAAQWLERLTPALGTPQALISSDLSRARETAELLLARGLRVPLFVEPALRELHPGGLQGLDRAEMRVRYGGEFADRLGELPLSEQDIARLGSESAPAVIDRVTRALAPLVGLGFERVVVVSHGGVIRRLWAHAAREFGISEFPPPIRNAILYPLALEMLPTPRWHMIGSLPYVPS